MTDFKAFSVKANGILREIITDIQISEVILEQNLNLNDPRIHNTKALWDTGATGCAITKRIADKVGLKPISQTLVRHADGENLKNVYLANIYLPNHVALPGVRVTECENTTGNFDVLIGMNVIALGDFSITNHLGKTCVSYRFPSSHEIDYVKHKNGYLAQPFKAGVKIGRNTPCPIDGKKKFKNCCGKKGLDYCEKMQNPQDPNQV